MLPEEKERPDSPLVASIRLSPAQLNEIEVEAHYKLHQAGSCIRESSSLTHTSEGGLRIQAIVDGEGRKQELLEALNGVAASPAVEIEIRTESEAIRQQMPMLPAPAGARRIEITRERIPVYAEVRDYLAKQPRNASKDVDDEVRRYASRVIGESRRALLHAGALKRHAEELARLSGLTANEQAKRAAMIREHAQVLRRETERLRLEIEALFFQETSDDIQSLGSDSDSGADLKAAERLFALASENERTIRKAFAVSSDVEFPVVRTERFRRSLKAAEEIAQRFE
jgi:ribonuclease HI